MNETFESFDYLKVTIETDVCSQYMDGYACFGWKIDENVPQERNGNKITLYFKRNRNIVNKMELCRLQQHYEACMHEILELEESKTSIPTILSLFCGLLGCAFMTGSVFAITATHPIIWLMVLFGILGFSFWIGAYFVYKAIKRYRTKIVVPLINTKYDEAYAVCAKGQKIIQ